MPGYPVALAPVPSGYGLGTRASLPVPTYEGTSVLM